MVLAFRKFGAGKDDQGAKGPLPSQIPSSQGSWSIKSPQLPTNHNYACPRLPRVVIAAPLEDWAEGCEGNLINSTKLNT